PWSTWRAIKTHSHNLGLAQPPLLCRAHAHSSRGSPPAPITGRVTVGRPGWAVIYQVLTVSGKLPGAILVSITDPVSVPQVGRSATPAGRSSITRVWRIHFPRKAASWRRFLARRTAV